MRLTLQEMMQKYPNQWIGIKDLETENNALKSADVIYTDKTASELGMMSLEGLDIQPFFTTPDNVFHLGTIGGLK